MKVLFRVVYCLSKAKHYITITWSGRRHRILFKRGKKKQSMELFYLFFGQNLIVVKKSFLIRFRCWEKTKQSRFFLLFCLNEVNEIMRLNLTERVNYAGFCRSLLFVSGMQLWHFRQFDLRFKKGFFQFRDCQTADITKIAFFRSEKMGKGTRATGKNLAKFRCGQSRLSQSVKEKTL